MPVSVVQQSLLQIPADAGVLSLEMTGSPAEGPAGAAVCEAGGSALRAALAQSGFLSVGRAAALSVPTLPWKHLLVTAVPRWLTGKANELTVLRCCYESLYALADELGCKSLAFPFLSSQYYRFPKEDAVHAALSEAEKWHGSTVFSAESEELYTLSQRAYRKPEILSYVGYYRDHALFALDNGLFARVDLRPELRRVDVIPYFEACFREGNNPLQPPLPAAEIARLRRIYEESDE